MTLRELIIRINGEQERRDAEFEREKWLIWHEVALRRSKKMPPLKRFLKGVPVARKLEGQELTDRREHHENVTADFNEYLRRKNKGVSN